MLIKKQRFRTALVRFGLSLHRDSPDDAVLDQCIALEALLSPGKTGITDAISTRYAIVVGGSMEERTKWRRQVRALYDIRSALVHGDDPTSRLGELGKAAGVAAERAQRIGFAPWLGQYLAARARAVKVEHLALANEFLRICSVEHQITMRQFPQLRFVGRQFNPFDIIESPPALLQVVHAQDSDTWT